MKGRAGAHYVMETGGAKFEWLLDGFGWDSEVQYAGDIDRDGKPDLIVYVNGNNSGTWYVLLSSEARPGMNRPSAQLSGDRLLTAAGEERHRDEHGHRSGRTFRPRRRRGTQLDEGGRARDRLPHSRRASLPRSVAGGRRRTRRPRARSGSPSVARGASASSAPGPSPWPRSPSPGR